MPNSISQIGLCDEVSDRTIEYSDTTLSLQEVATDLQEAHRELDEYRSSSLVLAQNLKELRLKAEDNGNVSLANTTKELEDSAMAVFERTTDATQ